MENEKGQYLICPKCNQDIKIYRLEVGGFYLIQVPDLDIPKENLARLHEDFKNKGVNVLFACLPYDRYQVDEMTEENFEKRGKRMLMEEKVRGMIALASSFSVDAILDDVCFNEDLTMTDVEVEEVLAEIAEEFNITFPDDATDKFIIVKDLLDYMTLHLTEVA